MDFGRHYTPQHAASLRVATQRHFFKGKLLAVTAGPFASFEGFCQWSTKDRVAVLLNILGQERPIPLLRSQITTA